MNSLDILSAMITPVVLILATGQLLLTTSQRLARTTDRARKLSDQFEQLALKKDKAKYGQKKSFLFELLNRTARRAKKLQRIMVVLYAALAVFVATCVSIGVLQAFGFMGWWLSGALGILGAALLFYASILLIAESRIALGSINREMGYLIQYYEDDIAPLQGPEGKEND